MTRRLVAAIAALVSTLILGCGGGGAPAGKTSQGGAVIGGGSRLAGIPLGAPVTAEGTLDRVALQKLAWIPALIESNWDAQEFAWGDALPHDPAWDKTPAFDPDWPIPDVAQQPDPWSLPIPVEYLQAQAQAEARRKHFEQTGERRAGSRSQPGESADKERATETKEDVTEDFEIPTEPQYPDPAYWVPVAYPRGPFEITYQRFTYQAEGLTLAGFAAVPEGEERKPIVILIHGMVPVERYSPAHLAAEAGFLASRGYLALVPDLRNYGASDVVEADAELIRLGWLRDVLYLMDLARKRQIPGGDGNRLALYGHGHGGALAMKATVIAPPQAVFTVAGMGQQEALDYAIFQAGMAPEVAAGMAALYGTPDNPEALSWYRNMSYTNFLDRVKCPVGMLGGELDPLVPVDQVRQLLSILTPLGTQALMSTFPVSGHNLYNRDWIGAMQTLEQFFDPRLQPPRQP